MTDWRILLEIYHTMLRKDLIFLSVGTSNTFEVETRFHFQDRTELFELLPFFKPCFRKTNHWMTVHYGRELFRRDIILRIGATILPEGNRSSLGWKGPDTGKFANIREEKDEEITNGINSSWILKSLGGNSDITSVAAIAEELVRLGHAPFMEFTGENQLGVYEPLDLQLKIMECPILQWPLLLEVEKTAHNPEEALQLEHDLRQFTTRYGLGDRVVRDEPPTLLYQARCAGK